MQDARDHGIVPRSTSFSTAIFSKSVSGIRGAFFCLAILLLPWQTRWFSEVMIAGWPWEYGRLSIYLSWIPMGLCVGIVFWMQRGRWMAEMRGWIQSTWFWCGIGFCVLTFISTRLDPFLFRAWFQWWLQIAVLGSFGWALMRSGISGDRIRRWMAISLCIAGVVGLIQFSLGRVVESKWLGLSSQDPAKPGVAVVETMQGRLLRAYGPFPHPNIFGLWMAFGVLVMLEGIRNDTDARHRKYWLLGMIFCSFACAASFSRSAWLGLILGLAWMVWSNWRSGRGRIDWRIGIPVLCLSLFFLGQSSAIWSRVAVQGRLESKSIRERSQSYAEGWRIWRAHPWIGVGINGDIPRGVEQMQALRSPRQPVHSTPFLILIQTGVFGLVLLIAPLVVLRPPLRGLQGTSFANDVPGGLERAYVFLILPAFAVDHFLWTLWSGQVFMMLLFLVSVRWPGRQWPVEDSAIQAPAQSVENGI